MNTVIYARVSTDEQHTDRQAHELATWAASLGLVVGAKYTETASGANDSRPVRAKLLADAKRGRVKLILVHELTRWSRSMVDLVQTLETLASYGCSVRALNGVDFDMTTPVGRMLAGVMGSLAQFERDLLRERVISGMKNAKSKGVKVGGRAKGATSERTQNAIAILKATPQIRICELVKLTGISRTTAHNLKCLK